MDAHDTLASRLIRASERQRWSLDALAWPDALDPAAWAMSPEWVSLAGTPRWSALSDAQQRALARAELANFFSLTLHGERPLVAGLDARRYDGRRGREDSRYLHHFLEEESRHRALFGEFCERYARVYPWRKLEGAEPPPGPAADCRFWVKALVIEELGLHYNALLAEDERLPPIVREINRLHRRDELRHVAYGREALAAAADAARADPAAFEALRRWTATYLRQSWADLCCALAYADAGIADPHEARAEALASPAFLARCHAASAELAPVLASAGLLDALPGLAP